MKAEKDASMIEVITKNNPEMTPIIMINAAGKLRNVWFRKVVRR